MTFRISLCIAFTSAAVSIGCGSITITKPADGSKNVTMPQDVAVTSTGSVTYGDVFLDNFNMSQVNGAHWQYAPTSRLFYVPVGSHVLTVSATDTKALSRNISQTSSFDVSSCPLCYACATGNVHPIMGQCCNNGQCDSLAFTNFGPNVFQSQKCQQALNPGSQRYYTDLDCISSNTAPIRGATAGSPGMSAVSFSPSRTGTLAHIQVPIGWESGGNTVQLSIMTDAAGVPGTVLETITQTGVRQQPLPTQVTAPVHVFSTAHTPLTAGTKYWLVIAPGASDTVAQWNLCLDDFSIPNTTTLLVTSSSNVNGPWTMKSALAELRPAFEIDVRE